MKVPLNLLETEFHDFILTGSGQSDGRVSLAMQFFEDNSSGIEVESFAEATISAIEIMTCNGVAVRTVTWKTDSADVLSLAQNGREVTLDLRWADNPTGEDLYDFYRFHGAEVRLTAERVSKGAEPDVQIW